MGTVTARLRVRDATATAAASYTIAAPTRALRVGWSSKPEDLAGRYAQYPGTKFVRFFCQPGEPLPAWSTFSMLDDDCDLQVSVKTRGLNWQTWMAARPARFRLAGQRVYGTIWHEPEQGEAAGDPPPSVFQQDWRDLCAHAKGIADLYLTPTFTRYVAEIDTQKRVTWYQNFGVVTTYDGVRAAGWDSYNYNGTRYLTLDEMYGWTYNWTQSRGLLYVASEAGRERRGTDVNSGLVCADVIRGDVAYAAARFAAWAWFYKGDCDLDTGFNGGPRLPERQALTEQIAARA